MKKKTTIIAMLTSLLIASCTHQVDITTTTTDATPLRIGQIGIAHTAATRIDIDAEAFAVNDQILVTANCFPPEAPDAPAATPSQPLSAIYSLTDTGWKPDAPDAAPIIAQHIDPATPITIHSWGGHATWSGSIDYTNQRTAQAYRLNDLLLCPAATLTAATLSGTLAHSRVDVVLRLTDAYPHQPLPTAATFTLGGATGKHIHTWRQGKTHLTTTFRACIDPADVPATLLGTLTFRAHGQDYTARINYTLTPPATQVEAGMRILIDATYIQPDAPEDPTPPAPTEYEVKATAKVAPWKNTDGGNVGTTDDLPTGSIAAATGESELDATEFTAANPVWMITGGAEASSTADNTEKQNAVLSNVKDALLNLNESSSSSASIHVMLTGFAGAITDNAFDDNEDITSCPALTSISAPAATSIGSKAFNLCEALTTVSAPAATSIGEKAFSSCTALTTASLPAATSIESKAFAYCAKLTTLELTGTKPITVAKDAFYSIDSFGSNDATAVTLVLNKDIKDDPSAIGVSISDKTVTFNNGTPDNTSDDVTVTFKAIEYITIN